MWSLSQVQIMIDIFVGEDDCPNGCTDEENGKPLSDLVCGCDEYISGMSG